MLNYAVDHSFSTAQQLLTDINPVLLLDTLILLLDTLFCFLIRAGTV